jgi:5-methylthioribose kinase
MARGEVVVTADVPARYRVLDEATLPDVLLTMAEVRERLGGDVGQWRVREVSDGNMNTVFMVEGPDGAVVAKRTSA